MEPYLHVALGVELRHKCNCYLYPAPLFIWSDVTVVLFKGIFEETFVQCGAHKLCKVTSCCNDH